jgi:hypothetical protein
VNIAVITLAKDDLEGLRRTEQSVVGQSIKVVWRIITPNDNSPTRQYADTLFSNRTVEAVISDCGMGIYNAMNLGISLTEANEWIWFLNSGDEFASPDAYEFAFKAMTSCKNRWVFGGHILGSSEGGILGEIPSPSSFKPEKQLFAKNHISHQSTIFETKFLKELGGFNESYKMAADWDLMVRASKLDSGFRLDTPLSIFYMGGISTKSRSMGNRELLILRKRHLPVRFRFKSYVWFYYRTVRNFWVQCLEKNFPNFTNEIRKSRINLRRTIEIKRN